MYYKQDFEKWLDENVNQYDYAIIDPPWNYDDKRPAMLQNQLTYNLWDNTKLVDIFKKINTSYIFLWVTNSMLPVMFDAVKESDYQFKVLIPWVKLTVNDKLAYGTGNSFRNCVEYLTLFQKPDAKVLRLNDRNLIMEQSGARTIKPKVWERELVDTLSHKGMKGVYIFSGGNLDFMDSVDIVEENKINKKSLFETVETDEGKVTD